jgi:ornithine decarboxylase
MAIETARLTLRKMQHAGLTPQVLNIGGGFPVRLTKPIPSIEVIGGVVNHALEEIPGKIEVIAEPGRYLVSDAGWLVCRVVGTAVRGGKRWLYLDTGMFGGLLETSDGLQYEVITDRSGPLVPWHVAGPTCDSVDVVMRDHLLPEDLQADDFVYLPNAAAYTTAYASNFNGFPLPEVRFVAR